MRIILIALIFMLSACTKGTLSQTIDIYNSSSDMIGTASISETSGGVKVKLKVEGLKPGSTHGVHIHEFPKCKGPDFKSAGNIFNPEGKKHGLLNQDGPQLGDLPNVDADDSGLVDAELVVNGAKLKEGKKSLYAGKGTSIVIKAKPDDGMTQPSGNSGKRIACGEIKKNKKGKKKPNEPTDPTKFQKDQDKEK